MGKFEKINEAYFNMNDMKNMTKAQFLKTYKDQRKHPFDSEDTWTKIQTEQEVRKAPVEVKK